jgi:hypothetical protein
VLRLIRAIACTLILVSAASALAACSGTFKASGGSVPPAAAPPQRVAQVYLRAAFTGDCRLTAELTTSGTWSWCNDPKLLSYRSVGNAHHVRAPEAGRNEECVSFEMDTHGSLDGSMPTGWQPWSLCFVKTRAGWRLYDQGQG